MKSTAKKLLSVLLAATMAFGSLALGLSDVDWSELAIEAQAAETFTEGYYTYSVEDGKATITDVDSSISGDVTIPSTLGGYPVTCIGDYAFSYCYSIISITLPNSITNIGYEPFCDTNSNYTSLKSITVDNSNTAYSSDEYGVLFNKDKTELIQYPIGNTRTSYKIPNGVTKICNNAFSRCSSLANVTIPDSIISIGYGAFYDTGIYNNATNWENDFLYIENYLIRAKETIAGAYSIKNGTKAIAVGAFSYCNNLTSITIPDSVTIIGDFAFRFCDSLTDIEIPDSITSISDGIFWGCTGLINITIPYRVTSIGDDVFWGCTGITAIVIPTAVKNIGCDAFYSCTALTDLYYLGTEDEWNSINNQDNNLGNVTIHYMHYIGMYENITWTLDHKAGILTISGTGEMFDFSDTLMPPWLPYQSYIKQVIIENGVTNIGKLSFVACKNLESVNIPDSVTSIGDLAFNSCASLKSISIPDSVKSLGAGAFIMCNNLSTVSLGNGITSIKKDTFTGCESLEEIIIPGNVTTIEAMAFYNCNLKDVTITADKTTRIEFNAFYLCQNLTNVTIGKGVTFIGEMAFDGCQKIANVFYAGTEEEWNAIDIGDGNEDLLGATFHFNYGATDEPTTEPTTKPTEPSTTNPSVEPTTKPVVTEPSTTKPVEVPTTKPTEPTTKPVVTEPSTTKPVEAPSTTKPSTTKPVTEPATKPVEVPTTKPTTEPTTKPVTPPATEAKATLKIKTPSTTTISYGDSIILHAEVENLPSGAKIVWEADNSNFTLNPSADGTACTISPSADGNSTITAKIVDADGDEICSDSQTMTSNAGFFQKIIAFFKSLFGMTKVIPEIFKI